MTAFVAASGARLPMGSFRPLVTGTGSVNNKQKKYVLAVMAYNKAKAEFNAAKKNYNKQKRNVSGGFRGWINRRKFGNAGAQARKARNNQLNANIQKKMNNAAARLKQLNSNYWNAKRWYGTLYNYNRSQANWALKQARSRS
jgi:hypothetical protein